MKLFQDRIRDGDRIICAEGYLFELERRGYCKAGPYVPDIIMNRPEVITSIHEEFAHAGSDILVSCLYYVNRWKLNIMGLEHQFEAMNRSALDLCKRASDKTNTLMAGNLCNSVEFDPSNDVIIQDVYDMFKDQVTWADSAGADLMICETFRSTAEASLALKAVKEYAPGLPVVVTLAPYKDTTEEGLPFDIALNKLYNQGADVVGLNCARGPETMIPLIEEIRQTYKVEYGPLGCNPVPYRTNEKEKSWNLLTDPLNGNSLGVLGEDLDCVGCSGSDIRKFGKETMRLGVNYVGLCCGNSGRYTRALAESIGHECPAMKYKSELSQSVLKMEQLSNSMRQSVECNC